MAVHVDADTLTLDDDVREPDAAAREEALTDGEQTAAGATAPACWSKQMLSALIVGLFGLLAVAGTAGWLGYGAYRTDETDKVNTEYLDAARQAAEALTTIGAADADADVNRILAMSTGAFHDDFAKRAPDFVKVVKQAQSNSVGTVTESGVESIDGDQSQVLLAVSVKTALPADPNPKPRGWRMRISLQKSDTGPKVNNVEFVP